MIVIRRRPYLMNFTGNPIVYEFFDNAAMGDPDMLFEIKVMFAPLQDGLAPQQLAIFPLTPHLGVAEIDLAPLLKSHLQFFQPALNLNSQSTGIQSGKFYVEFRSITLIETNPPWITTEVPSMRYAFKGGIAAYQWELNNFFESYYPQTKCFFTWQKRGRLTGLTENIFLTWLNKDYNSPDGANLQVKVLVTFTDGSTVPFTYLIGSPYNRYHFFYLAAGALQLGLPALQPAKTIWYWDVWVMDTTGGADTEVSEKFRFVHDMRKDYNDTIIHYRNSLGGLDPVRVRGIIESSVNLDGSDAEVAAAADWVFEDNIARMDESLPHREQQIYKAQLGHLEKDEQDRLRDLFLHREAYQQMRGKLVPIKLLTKQYPFRSSGDKRFTLPLEWTLADGGSYHYTPAIDLGAGLASSNVCASLVGLNIVGITWDGGNATVTIHWAIYGDAIGLQYRIPGYVEDWTDVVPFAFVGDFSFTVPEDIFVTIYFRATCAPGVYGATNSLTKNTAQVPPEPNSNVRNDAGAPFDFIFTRNATVLAAGTVAPGDYVPFYCPVGVANFKIVITGIAPIEGVMGLSDSGLAGTVAGNTITWPPVGPDAAGMTISIS
jgi:hypothetical protein